MTSGRRQLELKFDPSTIEDLGIKMYSQLPSALAELVANAYDAAAKNVEVKLIDSPGGKSIEIADDGEGMSYDDIQDKFLRIGRKQRKEGAPRTNSIGRRITGRKGIGKLALFGIGKRIIIESSRRGDKESVSFVLDWEGIIGAEGVYKPETKIIAKADPKRSGTKIVLTDLKRVSGFDTNNIAISLSKMFNCLGEDFKVIITDGESQISLSRELRYLDVDQQFQWDIGKVAMDIDSDYAHKNEIQGSIVSTKVPTKSSLRGVCLYANGRLANAPGFFDLSEAEHAYSYLSGWIDADFIDEFEEDLTSTDRQSLNWDMPEADDLRQFLQKLIKKIAADWNSKRKEEKKKKHKEITGIDVDRWKDTLTEKLRSSVDDTLASLDDVNSLDDKEYAKVVNEVHKLIPDFAQYHFRCLHVSVQLVSKVPYEGGDYYGAISQACIAYIDEIKRRIREKDPDARFDSSDRNLFGRAFGQEGEKLFHIFTGILRPNGEHFEQTTINNLEDSQRLLSEGIYTGFRDPLAHNTALDLKESNVISEQNCLDALSLISMLWERLDSTKIAEFV